MANQNKEINIECDVKDYLSIGDFTPLQGNLKTKTKEQLQKLKNQIIKYGFSFPVFVCKVAGTNFTMDGHGRDIISVDLKDEGYKFKRPDGVVGYDLPVVYVFAKSKTEAKEKLLALNSSYGKITEEGLFEFLNEKNFELKFNEIKLNLELPELNLRKFEQEYYPAEDGKLDDVPEPQKEAVSKTGDLFLLGSHHRLLCGDSTLKEDVELLMDGKKADMVFTDPPYGIKIVNVKGNIGFGGELGFIGAGGWVDVNAYHPIIGDETTNTALKHYNLCKELGINKFLLWGGNYYTDFLPSSSCWVIWDKREEIPSNNFADCEIAWTNLKAPSRIYKHLWSGLLRKGNRAEELIKRVHPTQKPVGMFKNIINDLKNIWSLFDGFLGSGSTLIACEQTNRICYGMEIDPIYIDVILRRYHNLYPDKEIICLNREYDFDKLFEPELVNAKN